MAGFHDLEHERSKRLRELENRVDCMTVDDLFQPIVSCSTTDRQVVELLVDGRVMTGFFDGAKGYWLCNGGLTKMPEGLYPSHWRKIKPCHERGV